MSYYRNTRRGSYRYQGGAPVNYVSLGVGILAVFVGYALVSYFRKSTEPEPKKELADNFEKEVSKQSTNIMQTGRTYVAVASDIYHSIFASSMFFPYQLKNTDEEYLGTLCLRILPGEYFTLSDTYNLYKKSQAGLFGSNILSTTLSDDLRNVFNSKERQMYLGHLPL
jgi:hypothetical protein